MARTISPPNSRSPGGGRWQFSRDNSFELLPQHDDTNIRDDASHDDDSSSSSDGSNISGNSSDSSKQSYTTDPFLSNSQSKSKPPQRSKAKPPPDCVTKIGHKHNPVYIWTTEYKEEFYSWWEKTVWAQDHTHKPTFTWKTFSDRKSDVFPYFDQAALINMERRDEGKPVMICKLSTCQEVLTHPEIRKLKSNGTRNRQKQGTSSMRKHLKS